MHNPPDLTTLKELLTNKLSRYFGVSPADATEAQVYKAVVLLVKDMLTTRSGDFRAEVRRRRAKRVYYLCMEFLVGRQLKKNLENLGLAEHFQAVLSELGFSLDSLYAYDPDPALGNGGLGRLAACYMDALSSCDYPATGFSLCYEYGLFRQRILDGEQIELPDEWLDKGEVWLVPRTDKIFTVRLGGHIRENWHDGKCDIIHENYEEVQALPYDLLISGAGGAVNNLRLWRAKDLSNFNMKLFSQGEYIRAMEESTNAEIISKVLYPADNHTEGKLLRLTQQYFLVSASLQNIISDHLRHYSTLANFADKVALHINDTHPALVIPELMRLLMDTYSYSWEDAWNTVLRTVTYTNHTVMPEALECWNEDLFRLKLPRIYMIICEINRRFCEELWQAYPGDWDRISRMSLIAHNQIRMANLSVVGANTVNGVSALHSRILQDTVFHDFYKHTPEKFTNVTNGMAHRRWLCYANPGLAGLLDETIGTGYRTDPAQLIEFDRFAADGGVLERLEQIKYENKQKFAHYAFRQFGLRVDANSLFDVQIKRMHEYKRQLLNAMRIISLYLELSENPNLNIQPQTFIFGAKAAPGYYMAKQLIKLISCLGEEICRQPRIAEKLNVVFIEDYNVSKAEIMIPAAEISEQISLAGKEASGTSNMKLMQNGAITLGTLDGANVEISETVGDENCFIFGLTTAEVEQIWRAGYRSEIYYRANPALRRVVDRLNVGFNGQSFSNLYDYLLTAQGVPDPYLCMADFDAYCTAHDRLEAAYADRTRWNTMSLHNIARAGIFSADRAVTEYAQRIWHLEQVKLDDHAPVF
ncbi:MAG: glycogen/starch/alpha-glucan phosphorylase [Clostridia bacterium]|nr:glycogen/starch/alpha-glucan phosphorylase [Clostridia bacterium]